MERTWTVIKFNEENAVEAVPTTWIVGTYCYWPPYTSEKMLTAIKNHEAPNTHWPSHKMEVFRNGTFASYLEARNKTKIAEFSSDLGEDASTRKFRRKKGTLSTSSSSEEEEQPSSLRKPPEKPEIQKITETPETGDGKALEEILVSPSVCSCCPVHKSNDGLFRDIRKQYLFLTNILTDIRSDIDELKMGRSNIRAEKPESLFTKFQFPLNDDEELKKVETFLEDDANFQNAVIEMSKFGGNNMYDFVKRCLSMLLTNVYASSYSWMGRKNKKPFFQLKIANTIMKAAELTKVEGDQKLCEESMKKWLRRAKERK